MNSTSRRSSVPSRCAGTTHWSSSRPRPSRCRARAGAGRASALHRGIEYRHPELRRGEVDLAANADRPTAPEIRADRVAETQHVTVVWRGHPLTHVETLTAARYASDEHITVSRRGRLGNILDDALARLDLTRRVVATTPTERAAFEFVRVRLPRHSPRIHGAFGRRRSRPDPATAPIRPATRRSQPTPTSDGQGLQVPSSRIAKWRLSEPHVVSTAGTEAVQPVRTAGS
ncbi:LysR substrate-binding domain-containing protein [Nocardia sp. NPDC004085]